MIDRLTILAREGSQHQTTHAGMLAQGVRAHGVACTVQAPGKAYETQHVACWGWRSGQALRAAGHDVLVMERGYIGDRFHWTSLGWNGLNGFAKFPAAGTGRFEANHAPLKPWNPNGSYVLLIGQVPGDMSLRGQQMAGWYAQAAKQCEAVFRLPARFRPHPESERRGYVEKVAVPRIGGALAGAMAGAACVVTYNSNTAVDALLAGKPAVAVDRGSMAWGIAASEIGPMAEPVRAAWAERLSWCQWSPQEIRSGLAWEHVRGCVK